MSTVTNLTELWHDSEKDDALLLTAKPTEGSDYARFCNLCDAFAEMPFHPIRRRAEKQLRSLFSCELPPLPENRETIWRLTAERLLLRPLAKEEADAVRADEPSADLPSLPNDRERFSDYPALPEIFARTYAEWESEQNRFLMGNQALCGLSLFLPAGFRAEKPSRYHADRHLSGEETNSDVWTVQIFRFLAYALQKIDKKILLRTSCDPPEIANLLALIASEVEIPPVLWMPERIADAERLIDLCRAYPNPDVSLAVRDGEPIDPCRLAATVPIGRVRVFR